MTPISDYVHVQKSPQVGSEYLLCVEVVEILCKELECTNWRMCTVGDTIAGVPLATGTACEMVDGTSPREQTTNLTEDWKE